MINKNWTLVMNKKPAVSILRNRDKEGHDPWERRAGSSNVWKEVEPNVVSAMC